MSRHPETRYLRELFSLGYTVIDLPDRERIDSVRAKLEKKLEELTGQNTITFDNYHKCILDDEEHDRIHYSLTKFFQEHRLGHYLVDGQLDLLRDLMGPDLAIQRLPHFRIARPDKEQDNIGIHRDTFYGLTAFEVSVVIPFVDLPKSAGISLIPGSQIEPDKNFPYSSVPPADPTVVRGSPKHELGFLYAPKLIDPSALKGLEAIGFKTGQALIFSLATIHGTTNNTSKITRFTTDIRLVSLLAALNYVPKLDYYEPLCCSPLTAQAFRYGFANNEAWAETLPDHFKTLSDTVKL